MFRNGPPPKPEPPIEIPVAPQLFLDDFLIDEQRNLPSGSSIRLASWTLNLLSGRTGPGRGTRSWVPKGSRYEFNEKQNRYELEYISLSRYRLLGRLQ